MTIDPRLPVSHTQRTVFRLATLTTLMAVVMGSVVCATESGAACPTWPGCHPGQIAPRPDDLNPLIEFAHRIVAIAAGPLILAAAGLSLQHHRREALVRVLPWVALVGAIAAALFGRRVVLHGLPPVLSVLDLGLSLMALIAITTATVAVNNSPYLTVRRRTALWGWAGLAVLLVMHTSGVLVAGTGSFTRCMGWPIWRLIDTDGLPAVQVGRIVLAAVATVLILAVVISGRDRADLRPWSVALVLAWMVELVTGVVMGGQRLSSGGAALYSTAAVVILWTLTVITAKATVAPVSVSEGEPAPDVWGRPRIMFG
ncbi:COX15/CtaA family protein [Austwickia chelonae]|uniref:COX15/CtaA family protein n=1 Tax=Austwickia chelonae TaxID=100225 RepID=UPI000E279BD9|nr:cytochrome oxidase assembly protein [Austwickia chelonae]